MNKKWIQKTKIPYDNKVFQIIVRKYLFECSVEIRSGKIKSKVSELGNSFRQRGLVGGELSAFLSKIKKNTASGHLFMRFVNSPEEIEKSLEEEITKHKDLNFECCVVYDSGGIGKTQSIFYCIRNSLAHGTFSYDHSTYYFESLKNKKLRGRIRLREQTLIKWIKLLEQMSK